MSGGKQDGTRRPMQVEQVRRSLLRDYQGLIYDADLSSRDQQGREQRFLSRALTAAAIRVVTKCDRETAGRAVIDGDDDQGIDGVAIDESTQHLWLVQAKWSDEATAKMDLTAAQRLTNGFRLIEARTFDRFNDRLDDPIAARVNSALTDPRLHVTMVIALMGPGTVTDAALAHLNDVCDEFNGIGFGSRLDHRVVNADAIHKLIREDYAPEPIDVIARMNTWTKRDHPFEAWQGPVPASDVARWYAEHQDGLFEENVRNPLGVTPINAGIKQTLLTQPENFWYFNNGITVLCDEIEPEWLGRPRYHEAVNLHLKGVSIVNGAQTVTAIHEAVRENADSVEEADVAVRVFSLGNARAEHAQKITETTNTQNDVAQRDFIALDPTQALIREDFRLSLDKTYTYKRGENDPSPDTGCSLVQAATALACAYRSPELAVRAKQDTDLLWERGSKGAYPRLFGERPGAYQIWRTFLTYREVGVALEGERRRLHGRGADIARRGDLLVTHLVFQLIDQEQIDDPAEDWQPVLDKVPGLTASVLAWLIYHIDAEYGKNSFLSKTFGSEDRCKELARRVLSDMGRGGTVPVLADDYRPPTRRTRKPRRPNAVPTLVSSGKLPNGTPLRYVPRREIERAAVQDWLAENPRRSRATWINDRVKCLLWEYDEKVYSTSGLVSRIWELAGYENAPVSVQGPSRWSNGDKTLWELALEILADETEDDEDL